MSKAPDFARMRELTMQDGQDDMVTVNTRALIDKVLARYSAEFTTLRELVQNAADAGATTATIRFETLPSTRVRLPDTQDQSALLRHVVKNHTLRSLSVSNNGKPFTDADWARLRCIAEGNPDETKIGAFGVGFYSVFSECDTPFVISGDKTMAFYWRGNTLAVKTSALPAGQASGDTSFILDYRTSEKDVDITPSPVPDLLELSKFLTTSLTFLALQKIQLFVDDYKIMELTKTMSDAVSVPLPSNIGTTSSHNLMKIRDIVHENAKITASWCNIIGWDRKEPSQEPVVEEPIISAPSFKGFFKKTFNIGSASQKEQEQKLAQERAAAEQKAVAEDSAGISTATVTLHLSTINITSNVPSRLANELLRATKKQPPKQTRLAILTTPHAEWKKSVTNSSGLTVERTGELFASALPTHQGRIFIGFSTGQTTGYQCHIFAPSLIPTVERESIDLSNRHVSTWNESTLEIAGIACRIAFSRQMSAIKAQLTEDVKLSGNTKTTLEQVSKLIPKANHLLNQYTSRESTPFAQVGKYIDEGFWRASKSFEILSTCGVLPAKEVRVFAQRLAFLRDFPFVPEKVLDDAEGFIQRLLRRGFISQLTIEDISRKLEDKPLDEDEMREFLHWVANMSSSNAVEKHDLKQLFNAAILTVDQSIIALGSINFYLIPSKYPPDLSYPDSCMPLKYTKDFSRVQLEGFGWQELPVEEWIRHLLQFNQLTSAKSITKDPEFASLVLKVISKQWDHMKAQQRADIVNLLRPHPVMPTKNGMQKPQETYEPNVKIFDDLPNLVVTGLKPKLLEALGLRRTIDMDYLFNRLLATPDKDSTGSGPKWSHMDVIEYLADVKDAIPAKDRLILADKKMWPIENYPGVKSDTTRLYSLREIYEPSKDNKELGLPVIKWRANVEYKPLDTKGKFLKEIGLRRFPDWSKVIEMIAYAVKTSDAAYYETVIRYFISNRSQWPTATPSALADKELLPVEGIPFPYLVPPTACVTNRGASIFGYNILRADLIPHAATFGVSRDPPIEFCVQRLIRAPPRSKQDAAIYFGYMASRIADIQGQREVAKSLGEAPIVPIPGQHDASKVRHIPPQSCYVGESKEYGAILNFVDFGSISNSFLRSVGAKDKPNILELARMVVDNPAKVLKELGAEKYQGLLKQFAVNYRDIKGEKTLWNSFKTYPILLALKDEPVLDEKAGVKSETTHFEDEDDDEDSVVRQVMVRAAANQIVTRDNVQYYAVFRGSLLVAPEDEDLEKFYMLLGAEKLSDRVQVEKVPGNPVYDGQKKADKLKALILERVPIFLINFIKDQIFHDSRWLEHNLDVKVVSHLTHRLQAPGMRAVSLKMSAGLVVQKGGMMTARSIILYVTDDYDFFEVSRELVPLLLKRQNPKHETLILETILSNSLRRLRDKGYDVHRILARKEKHQARLAEEEKQRITELEKQRAEEAEKQQAIARQAPVPGQRQSQQFEGTQLEDTKRENARPQTPDKPKMPGAFGSPDDHQPSERQMAQQRPGEDNALARTRNSFMQKFREFTGNNTPNTGTSGGVSRGGEAGMPNDNSPNNPTQTSKDLQTNLNDAIKSCRAHNSSQVKSAGETKEIGEAKGSYCDTRPAKDLSRWYTEQNGMTVFLSSGSSHAVLSANDAAFKNGIVAFSQLLAHVARVFQLDPRIVNIFYEDVGSTIAFNQGGALFFNYHYFQTLHLPHNMVDRAKMVEAMVFWWEAFCHEIAHNLSSDHSAAHVFYEGSLIKQTFNRMMMLAAGQGVEAAVAAA
ncbi:uncharacterized protein K452DRAFT_263651 [Aplosporella prunicola CBS 121167]|uniref:Sacsin/Nov domain-containing protein n=1 Tax=Aplosporella prunicola CBS 121167 TaxID=1176127 RepID=A0A6A6BQ34_9PEZI|nr:uncharacterized protein K452DRAFT_263651 [Aplosporella prunicola CBS 121167]KAF2146100.1 hypothetical protein K452DRAFT_263651 [Aplosporella prunicola CBS 121167]